MRTIAVFSITLLGLMANSAEAAGKTAADLELNAPAKLKNGKSAELSLRIKAHEGWKLSLEAPLSIKLTAPDNLKLKKAKLGAADASGDKKGTDVRFPTTVTAAAKGKGTVQAKIVYFMCTEEVCKRFTAKKEVALQVN